MKKFKYIIFLILIYSCENKVDYKNFIDKYEKENVFFLKEEHITYRGKNNEGDCLFSYYKKSDSLSKIYQIIYKKNGDIDISQETGLNSVIDTVRTRNILNLFVNLGIKSLRVDIHNQIKIDLDEYEGVDLIKVVTPFNLNDYQKLNYISISGNWYKKK
jgi:hypothetical protein